MYQIDDTIAAIASAPGGAARGIVRLSGPDVIQIVEACFRPHPKQALGVIQSAMALGGSVLLNSPTVSALPAELYLWPNRRSYTRQPVAEFHTLGSPPLVSALLKTVCSAGARLAEPGEFTLRAFLAGRLDLTQAEAVLGIIDARSQQDLSAALAQLAGGLATPLKALRDSLLDLLAQLEAGLDFAEEDIQFITSEQIRTELDRAIEVVAQLTRQLAARTHSDAGPRVALVGWPNVGKSSLFNVLSQHGTALVSNEPGTTRDYLIVSLAFDGTGCQLVDTAGAEPHNRGENIGGIAQQFSASQARQCDIRLLCLDATRPLNDWERGELAVNHLADQLVVITKCDGPRRLELACDAIETSALAGLGLQRLRLAIHQAVVRVQRGETAATLTGERCGESLRKADESLLRAAEMNQAGNGEELIAAELRVAVDELGKVAGAVYTDDILDRIFSRFCIGK
ncbi:MAG TPA: tRNA modification GTPase [Pirellulales bacterium]|nr:tRNA modification GTPase [Pirellulales bacterium]